MVSLFLFQIPLNCLAFVSALLAYSLEILDLTQEQTYIFRFIKRKLIGREPRFDFYIESLSFEHCLCGFIIFSFIIIFIFIYIFTYFQKQAFLKFIQYFCFGLLYFFTLLLVLYYSLMLQLQPCDFNFKFNLSSITLDQGQLVYSYLVLKLVVLALSTCSLTYALSQLKFDFTYQVALFCIFYFLLVFISLALLVVTSIPLGLVLIRWQHKIAIYMLKYCTGSLEETSVDVKFLIARIASVNIAVDGPFIFFGSTVKVLSFLTYVIPLWFLACFFQASLFDLTVHYLKTHPFTGPPFINFGIVFYAFLVLLAFPSLLLTLKVKTQGFVHFLYAFFISSAGLSSYIYLAPYLEIYVEWGPRLGLVLVLLKCFDLYALLARDAPSSLITYGNIDGVLLFILLSGPSLHVNQPHFINNEKCDIVFTSVVGYFLYRIFIFFIVVRANEVYIKYSGAGALVSTRDVLKYLKKNLSISFSVLFLMLNAASNYFPKVFWTSDRGFTFLVIFMISFLYKLRGKIRDQYSIFLAKFITDESFLRDRKSFEGRRNLFGVLILICFLLSPKFLIVVKCATAVVITHLRFGGL